MLSDEDLSIKMDSLMTLAKNLETKHRLTTQYLFVKLQEFSIQINIMRDIKNGYYGCR